ncbi:MAG TPA: hypothetical protein VFR19_13565 [Hyphomicrobiaceae bacterium]|nr:hypothetical protein [Hyphomicrobiaceae bacterium]
MRRAVWAKSARSVRPPRAARQAASGSLRDRLAMLLAFLTVVCLGSGLFLTKGTQFLMPGPLASAHGTIENCSACHSKSGSDKLSWIHGLVRGDPLADSKACLTCHKMPDTAFNAHSASAKVLDESTKRLAKIAAATPAPQSARAQSIAFPTDEMVAHGLSCATCHQEHQGVNFKLNKISNEQCRSCHVVKFDSFDGNHPKFENYPFKRRTRIIYDHAGHFGKHFPEVAKKDPTKRIPTTCSTCHNSHKDKRVMAVAPFEQTCTACHLDQIIGKERASGPKGIAFLTLPGLDLQTLKKKGSIGEWPDASEAELTPFMKAMISRNERGRALIKTVDSLNLQDLSRASDAQLKAVNSLVWEIKRLFYALITGKASDVLAEFNIGARGKLSANLIADLTASIPRDVVSSAQQQWLPNLATEMANRQEASDQAQARKAPASKLVIDNEAAGNAKPSRPAQGDQQTPSKSAPGPVAAKPAAAQPEAAANKTDAANARPGKEATVADERPQAKAADQTDDLLNPTAEELRAFPPPSKVGAKGLEPEAPAQKPANANARPNKETAAADERPGAKAADQTDDLLNPTQEELRGGGTNANAKAKPDGGAAPAPSRKEPASAGAADSPAPVSAPAPPPPAPAEPPATAARLLGIESDVDAESWAEYGGWYRQDYAIFYRPIGHKDKFIYSWLSLTGPKAQKGTKSPAAAVFDLLTSKDAQGSCTKCHSVDDIRGKGRLVNFSPPSVESKRGRFTNFIHEPHFGVLENRGCLTCHSLEKGRAYLKSYEQGNPQSFVSNFGAVKKDLCQTCHTSSLARQDCLLCHKYHVNGVITPIMTTKIPIE